MNILSFDLEEWLIYERFRKGSREYYEPIIEKYLFDILDLLDEYHVKATFFCLGIIARKNIRIIKLINERGHEIGCHSDKHISITDMSVTEFNDDLKFAINSLEQAIGKKILMYRAPYFSITKDTKWAIEILIQNGILFDSSFFPNKNKSVGCLDHIINEPALLLTKSGIIKEFPVNYTTCFNKVVVFSGGGYFRILPYSIIKTLMSKSNYNLAYFHIRDFDKKQIRNYSQRYFHNYLGIDGSFRKFKTFLNDFKFISLGHADGIIDWDKLNKIEF